MSDIYLTGERIVKRYDSINNLVTGCRNIGLGYGIAFFTLSLGKGAGELLVGGGLAVSSYYTGKFISNIIQKKKDKALTKINKYKKENLEDKAAA